MKQKFQSPRPFYKGSYTSFAKAIKIRFDLLQIGHPQGLYHWQSITLPYKQTEDRKHGTKVVQTNDAGPARAGTD